MPAKKHDREATATLPPKTEAAVDGVTFAAANTPGRVTDVAALHTAALPILDLADSPVPADANAVASAPAHGSRALKIFLALLDLCALALAWSFALVPGATRAGWHSTRVAGVVAITLVAALAFARAQGLYRARVCVLRSDERARLMRLALVAALVAAAGVGVLDVGVPVWRYAAGAAAAFVALVLFRGTYRSWLALEREHGNFVRPVVIAGDDDEGSHVVEMIRDQPALGFRVVGYVGRPPEEASAHLGVPWLGPTRDAPVAVERSGATGVVVVPTSHAAVDLNVVVKAMLERGIHVHYTTALHGVSHHRLRPFPLSHEPFFYVEPGVPSRAVLRAKRVLDLVVGGIAALLFAPIITFAAMLVKLEDRGPVFFRQERIGRDGHPFRVVKLRTMRPDAEALLEEVRARNARVDGPLFKDPRDPRRTRIGSLLEATSIDELPQLWNVLKGEMSLVGPRPALAHEVATFDRELLTRHRVRPGITGLWQVESRDNPRFGPYRRLDLMYVENLSLSLDLAILSLTVQRVLVRGLALLSGRRQSAAPLFGPDGS